MPTSSTHWQMRFQDTNEDILKEFDEEIAQLEARLLSLKLTRNKFALVSRLHPEILQEIFSFAHFSSSSKGKASLTITWVCHQWRKIAHHISSLWSYIDFTNQEWVETALSRSKNRELRFNFYDNRHVRGDKPRPVPSLSLIQLCLENLSRTRSFEFDIRLGGWHQLRRDLLSAPEWTTPARLLRNLSLENLCLPRNPFSGIFPRLQSLHLCGCIIDWDTLPLVSGLKDLVIEDPNPRASAEKIAQLLCIVQDSLEELTLRKLIGPSVTPQEHGFHRPHFTNLLVCDLVEEESHCIARILKYLSFPRRTRISVCPFQGQSQWEGSTEMVSALVASRNMEKWPVESVYVDVEEESFSLRIDESLDINDSDGTGNGSVNGYQSTERSILLDFGFEGNIQVIPIFDLLPIHPITKFCLSSDNTQIIELLTYLGDLGTVQDLTILSDSMVTFLGFVQDRTTKLGVEVLDKEHLDESSKKVAAQSALSFSNLQKLSISGHSVEEEYSGKCEELLPLRDWLKWRMVYGFPLKWVELRDVLRSELDRVRELLFEVCDGVEVKGVREG